MVVVGGRGWGEGGGGGRVAESLSSLLSPYYWCTCIMYNTACLMNDAEVSERGKKIEGST